MIRVLVTGVGGPLGQAILKALRCSGLDCHVLGTDRAQLSVGFDWVDGSRVLPDCAREEKYLQELRDLCREEAIQVVLPASEGELRVLSRAISLFEAAGTAVIASSPPVLDIALNKLETCWFLETAGLNFPHYAAINNAEGVERLVSEFGYPLIAKPCHGSGSQGLFQVRNPDDLNYLLTLDREYVLQEYLQPDDQEYTVGCFTDREGEQIGAICMRRELAGGNTYRAWVVDKPNVQQEAMNVVRAIGARGPCNVQLRLTSRGPVAFEINPRFSGTTGMRANFGYNEVEMAIRNFVLNEPLASPTIEYGIALRFWDECYLRASA